MQFIRKAAGKSDIRNRQISCFQKLTGMRYSFSGYIAYKGRSVFPLKKPQQMCMAYTGVSAKAPRWT